VIGAYLLVSILHAMWDGLPLIIAYTLGQGLSLLIAWGMIGIVGLVILWLRWREAVKLQMVLPPETEDI